MKCYEITKEHTHEDANGNITVDTTTETSTIINEEPDYIKLYTKAWLDMNNVPDKWKQLFLSLVCRMSYASMKNPVGGQVVYTVGSNAQDIIQECGWKNKDTMYRGLQALCECNAIKKLGRGEYQINPQYAGKGPWQYNPKLERGGVKNIIAKFNYAEKSVDTKIIWASNDQELIGKHTDKAIAEHTTVTAKTALQQYENVKNTIPNNITDFPDLPDIQDQEDDCIHEIDYSERIENPVL